MSETGILRSPAAIMVVTALCVLAGALIGYHTWGPEYEYLQPGLIALAVPAVLLGVFARRAYVGAVLAIFVGYAGGFGMLVESLSHQHWRYLQKYEALDAVYVSLLVDGTAGAIFCVIVAALGGVLSERLVPPRPRPPRRGTGQADLSIHMERAWDMVVSAVGNCTDEQWRAGDDAHRPPARIAYHILKSAERYTWTGNPERYDPQRVYSLDWEQADADDLPARDECIGQLEEMKARSLDWVATYRGRLARYDATWPWTGRSALGQAIYLLRHLQHHLGELNVILRSRGLPIAEWK